MALIEVSTRDPCPVGLPSHQEVFFFGPQKGKITGMHKFLGVFGVLGHQHFLFSEYLDTKS